MLILVEKKVLHELTTQYKTLEKVKQSKLKETKNKDNKNNTFEKKEKTNKSILEIFLCKNNK